MSSDAIALVVGDGLLMAGTVTAAFLSSRRTRGTVERTMRQHSERVDLRLDKIERHTDTRLDRKIESVVRDVVAEHPGLITTAAATEAARELLRGLIVGIAEYDDDPDPPGRRRAHDR